MWLSNQVLAPGEWNHLALVRSGEDVTLYMNGLPDSGVQFSASLYPYANWACVGPIWQYFGTEPVVVDELLIAATAALPPAGEPEAPSGIYASLYIPESLTAGACDVVRYFHGLRDAGPADPAFAEAEGEPASLVFRGTFQGVETTIALDPATFAGLTENVDSFEASITHSFANGTTTTVTVDFTETAAESCVFRGQLPLWGGEREESPAGMLENIYLPSALADDVADEIRYFKGDREPAGTDPVLRERVGGEASRVFHGTMADGMPITIAIETPPTLTAEVDSFEARVIQYTEGVRDFRATFTETGAETKLFRASVTAGWTNPFLTRVATVRHSTPLSQGVFRPFKVRMAGAPNAADMCVSIAGGPPIDATERDGWLYAESDSELVAFVRLHPHEAGKFQVIYWKKGVQPVYETVDVDVDWKTWPRQRTQIEAALAKKMRVASFQKVMAYDMMRPSVQYEVPNSYDRDRSPRCRYMVMAQWCENFNVANPVLKATVVPPPGVGAGFFRWKLAYDGNEAEVLAPGPQGWVQGENEGAFDHRDEAAPILRIKVIRKTANWGGDGPIPDFRLNVGADFNGNGRLDESETLLPPLPIVLVTKRMYEEGRSFLDWYDNSWLGGFWFASALLEHFRTGNGGNFSVPYGGPDYCDIEKTYVIQDFPLRQLSMWGHGVDAVDHLKCRLPVYTFNDGSYPSRLIKRSSQLKSSALRNLVQMHRPAIVAYFNANPTQVESQFHITGQVAAVFPEGDLGSSVNECQCSFLDGTVVTVIRDATGFRVDTAYVKGRTWDIYDWDFTKDRKPAAVQVGYEPQCAPGTFSPWRRTGWIFGHHIEFTCHLANCGISF